MEWLVIVTGVVAGGALALPGVQMAFEAVAAVLLQVADVMRGAA